MPISIALDLSIRCAPRNTDRNMAPIFPDRARHQRVEISRFGAPDIEEAKQNPRTASPTPISESAQQKVEHEARKEDLVDTVVIFMSIEGGNEFDECRAESKVEQGERFEKNAQREPRRRIRPA